MLISLRRILLNDLNQRRFLDAHCKQVLDFYSLVDTHQLDQALKIFSSNSRYIRIDDTGASASCISDFKSLNEIKQFYKHDRKLRGNHVVDFSSNKITVIPRIQFLRQFMSSLNLNSVNEDEWKIISDKGIKGVLANGYFTDKVTKKVIPFRDYWFFNKGVAIRRISVLSRQIASLIDLF